MIDVHQLQGWRSEIEGCLGNLITLFPGSIQNTLGDVPGRDMAVFFSAMSPWCDFALDVFWHLFVTSDLVRKWLLWQGTRTDRKMDILLRCSWNYTTVTVIPHIFFPVILILKLLAFRIKNSLWKRFGGKKKKKSKKVKKKVKTKKGKSKKAARPTILFYFHSIFARVIVIFFAFRPAFDHQ